MSLLEAMLFPQQQLQEEQEQEQELFGYEDDEDHFYKYLVQQQQQEASSGCFIQHDADEVRQGPPATTKRKRRRTRTLKNKEELENQRMTHINVERNRRKQMNYYLAVLRSMMPPSYVPRGDQGSIVGGAINYVKELEHLLRTLEAEKQTNDHDKEQEPLNNIAHNNSNSSNNSIFSNFFAFPQYSTLASIIEHDGSSEPGEEEKKKKKKKKGVADVEVTVVEGHANVKVKSRRRPKQLMKMVVAFQSLRLTILHLNVTTIDLHVLYSFSVKVEDDCEVASVDEIAGAVHEIVSRIHHEDLEVDYPNCSIN